MNAGSGPLTDLEKLIGRLLNWKFDSAAQMLSASDTTEAACVIRALAAQFGNCGHIDGQMGELIGSVVDLLLRNLKPTSKPEGTPHPPSPARRRGGDHLVKTSTPPPVCGSKPAAMPTASRAVLPSAIAVIAKGEPEPTAWQRSKTRSRISLSSRR